METLAQLSDCQWGVSSSFDPTFEIKVMMSPEVCRPQARDMAGPDPLLYNVVSLSHNCQLYRLLMLVWDVFSIYLTGLCCTLVTRLFIFHLNSSSAQPCTMHVTMSGAAIIIWCEQQLVSPVTSHHPVSACHLSPGNCSSVHLSKLSFSFLTEHINYK